MKSHCLEVSGDFACFTRPEMKVERVSYDVITPLGGTRCIRRHSLEAGHPLADNPYRGAEPHSLDQSAPE